MIIIVITTTLHGEDTPFFFFGLFFFLSLSLSLFLSLFLSLPVRESSDGWLVPSRAVGEDARSLLALVRCLGRWLATAVPPRRPRIGRPKADEDQPKSSPPWADAVAKKLLQRRRNAPIKSHRRNQEQPIGIVIRWNRSFFFFSVVSQQPENKKWPQSRSRTSREFQWTFPPLPQPPPPF